MVEVCTQCINTSVCEDAKSCCATWSNFESRPMECEDCEHPALPYEGMEEFFKGWVLTDYVDQLYGYELSDEELNKALYALFCEYVGAGVLVISEDSEYIREYYEWAQASPDVYLRCGLKALYDYEMREFVNNHFGWCQSAAREEFETQWANNYPHLRIDEIPW